MLGGIKALCSHLSEPQMGNKNIYFLFYPSPYKKSFGFWFEQSSTQLSTKLQSLLPWTIWENPHVFFLAHWSLLKQSKITSGTNALLRQMGKAS